MCAEDNEVVIEVEDNGVGMDERGLKAKGKGNHR